MLKPGTILDDRYEIIDVVGTGGMSTVYRAKDDRLKRFVAIKVLKSDYSSDANFVSKFKVEAQSSAGLTHPNIVSVYDVCEDEGRHFIVMELVEGITLKEYVNLNGRLSMAQAIDFSIQIASGLEAAHEHHVIHRDIKPQNIIVSKSGNIKVTDFGIAKAATSTTMSTTGIGSVHYISPEQARGGYSDERSDIYSLGITMYEMVTGRVPFEGDTNVAIALMHIQNDMIRPRELYPDIYPSFEKIILKATQKKPERRYLTAAALIADLNRVKENPNIDIIVAPTGINGAPTQKFTDEDMQRIKNGRMTSEQPPQQERYDNYQNEYRYDPNQSSEVKADRSKIDSLLREDDDDYDDYDDYDIPQRPTGSKRVEPEYEDNDEGYDDDEEDVDPKLEKAVMVGGIAAAVIIAIIVFIVIGNIMGWFPGSAKNKKTTEKTTVSTTEGTTEVATIKMINVKGLSKKAAGNELAKAGFTNVTFNDVNDENTPEGYAVSQNVESGKEVPADTQIIISISVGAEELEITDVSGMTLDDAKKALEAQGFKVTSSYEFSDEVEKDKIISQSPAAKSKGKKGDIITLVVSNGKEEKTVKVPDLANLTEGNARSAIENAKLVVGSVTYEYNSSVPEGQVISQNVAAGTEVKEQTSVGFVISNGAKAKTYKGTVTGNISTGDEEFIASTGVVVKIYINDEGGYHEVTSTSADPGNSGSISIEGSAGGLSYNNGSPSFSVTDTEGNDVTTKYTSSLTLSYAEE